MQLKLIVEAADHPVTKPLLMEPIMKKIAALFSILSILFLISCESSTVRSDGRPGEQGPPGEDGLIGQGFEVEANFTPSNEYSEQFFFVDVPGDLEVFDTDIVVVYWLFGVSEGAGNDIWQQLPATTFFEDGQFQYTFDHTLDDVQLFLQGNVDLDSLGSDFTENQVFRVAILPVEYVNSNDIDLSNMEQVMGAVKQQKFERIKIQ
jgi:hypothetical protein